MAVDPILFPVALAASLGSGFMLWFSLSDYERARYYPIILGVPALLFATLGLVGISANQPPTLEQVVQAIGNPLGAIQTQGPTTVIF